MIKPKIGQTLGFGIGAIIIIVILLNTVFYSVGKHIFYHNNLDVTITREPAVKRYDDKDIYLIYTDNGTYCLEDSYWPMHFRSTTSDVFGKIETGKKYKIYTCGLRIGFFSMYPNITYIQEKSQV